MDRTWIEPIRSWISEIHSSVGCQREIDLPIPRSRARSYTSAATATSSIAIPWDLNNVMSSSFVRPRTLPATTSLISWTRSHVITPRFIGSTRSPPSSFPCSLESESPNGAARADRLQLALCLPSRADDADRRCIGAREIFRRDARGRSSPLLSEAIGLNHGEQFAGRHVEQVDPKANSCARRGVILESSIAARRPRCEHHVDRGLSGSDSLPWAVGCLASPHGPQSFLDGHQRIVHLEEALDLLFRQEQRGHRSTRIPKGPI